MLSKELTKAINQQIANELGASNQYLQITAYYDSEDLNVLKDLFYEQAQEEHMHAMKLYNFLLEAGVEVEIPQVEKPKAGFKTALEAAELALAWEKEVTQQIYNLVNIAQKDGDYISQRFLDWFVTEQLEEISKMSNIAGIIEKAGDNILLAEQIIAMIPAEGEA